MYAWTQVKFGGNNMKLAFSLAAAGLALASAISDNAVVSPLSLSPLWLYVQYMRS